MTEPLFGSLIIHPNERTDDVVRLLSIACAEAKRKEGSKETIIVRALVFVSQLGIYLAVYEKPSLRLGRVRR